MDGIILRVLSWTSSQAPVAQWIARWTSNPKVVGSSPTWGKTFRFAQHSFMSFYFQDVEENQQASS